MSIDRYDPIRILGEGSFGKVYLMRDKVKRNFVCVKIIKIKNIPKKEREATRVEVDLLRRLNHPNIVRYVDSFLSKNGESLCICMEYCDGGDLASQIKAARRNLFSESKILHWFVQLALGLHYMHGNKVLHRDLKTQNVFMLGNGRLVLGDLGISKVLDGTMDFAQTCIGTPYYMSPEIFKNKPYSYKSDVWALGCVLYEMTTLNHAFDANSLNGLATKIVKGKYPPISPKYSKHLSDLISQMLQLNPQQRPDLDQILRKPFIKKHIINFFTDIASRPSNSVGEGTMVIKAAVGAAHNGAASNDSNMISLRQQLNSLGMTEAVAEALAPKASPQDDVEAIKLAKEQASALQREKEHKKMVEAALEKLRQERENRAKERAAAAAPQGMVRPSGYPIPQARYAGAAAGGRNARAAGAPAAGGGAGANAPPSARNPSIGGGNNAQANVEAARREAMRRYNGGQVDDSNADDGNSGGAGRRDPARRRSFGEDADRDSLRAAERDRRAAEEQRRQEDAQKARAEERRREEARIEARAREEQRQREESKAKEEVQARLRVEQLKVEQVRAQAEQAAKAKREAQREKERARQREEIEQLKRDKLILDQRTAENARVREERRAQERERLEGNRREQIAENHRREQMEAMQDKLVQMNDQISKIEIAPRQRPGPLSDRAEEKEELNARERVLMRRQEKQAREEAERLEQLRAAENENRRIRQEASQQARHLYHGDYQHGYEFDTSDRGGKGRMEAGELNDRLNEATKGKGPRYDSNMGGGRSGGGGGYAGEGVRYESDSGSDVEAGESLFDVNNGDAPSIEEEEDMIRREQELRAELNFATCRVEELKRTLQETKSFLGPRLPTRGRDAPPTAKGRAVASHSEDVYAEEEEVEDDDDLYFEESDEDEEIAEDAGISASSKASPSNYNNHGGGRHGGDHKLDIGDTVRMQAAVPSAYGGLQDLPSPSGRLSDRIERLRQRCTEALGREAFREAYSFLKQHEEESQGYDNGRDLNDEDYEAKKIHRMRAILGEGKAHYMSLIEQLIFMEETHMG